jgi:hypothetical protein
VKPRGDVWDLLEGPEPAVGSASTLSGPGARVPERAFPPGFAGANPGPSHDEPARKTPRRRKETKRC